MEGQKDENDFDFFENDFDSEFSDLIIKSIFLNLISLDLKLF